MSCLIIKNNSLVLMGVMTLQLHTSGWPSALDLGTKTRRIKEEEDDSREKSQREEGRRNLPTQCALHHPNQTVA